MLDKAELKDLLDRLARRFEDEAQPSVASPSMCGWGQFLDTPRRYRQTGSYGTSAGVIAIALAGRGASALARQATSQLCHWWKDRDRDAHIQQRFVQTTRLAFLNLALRLSDGPDAQEIRAEVEEALLARLLPYQMWGNYWVADEMYDPTPRVLPTAIAVLSFTLLRVASSSVDGRILSAVEKLEEKLTLSDGLPPLEVAATSAAILSVRGSSAGRRVLARMSASALSRRPGLEERSVYFYDYEYSPDAEGQSHFGRDYFIVPLEALFGIAGFQPGTPGRLRLRAEDILTSLARNLRQNDGAYRPAPRERLSSVDQAWYAILLKLSASDDGAPRPFPRLWYELLRGRRDNWFTDKAFPILSMLIVTGLAVLTADAGPAARAFAAVSALIIGGLFGPTVIRKLIPERE